jgi:DNA polymerase-3 subunit alpha
MDTVSSPGFAHLHLHTEYSLLDGGNKITRLMERVRTLGMPAVAITDHGNLHGVVEFYTKAHAAGIKPILGIEAYVAPGDRRDRTPSGIADGGFHLVLLAENQAGWRNLLKLNTDAFINGFYYKPRMDKETLAAHADGLIAINGHLGSSIAHHLVQHVQTGSDAHWEAALEEARWHAATFGTNERGQPRFYVELQRHGVEEQERINPSLRRLAETLDLPLVADNDAHYLTAEDHDVHDTLCCISMGKTKDEPSRLRYSPELYVKSPEQMAALFEDVPEALANTVRIAERCNVELDFETNHAPVVKIVYRGRHEGTEAQGHEGVECSAVQLPIDAAGARALIAQFDCEHETGSTEWYQAFCSQFDLEPYDAERDVESADDLKRECDGALRMLAEAGAIWRYGESGLDHDKRARLDRELTILADKLISAYFLIVWDFVHWAKERSIPANARGSGVGTIVGYVLGLSNACPERYGLLFERFTDPDRSEYPDIDIDICQDGRADVINYVREKYGHVAQIITFGRLKAKAALKDVSRVMGLSPAEGQRLANLVPNELNITLDAALVREPDLKTEYDRDATARTVIDSARALEDHARHAGIHAAGVVIATQPLDNIVPLCRATGSEDIITQWDGPTCERVGLLKMDFLGLRTLSTIERARALIQQTLPTEAIWRAAGRAPDDGGPHPLDLERLQYDDQRVLDLFRRGDTAGIFQFESGGMRKLLVEMQPDRLEDLIAANALFRPGPMDLIPEYCQRKHGRRTVPSIHPIVDELTAETYGIMVYQEQVMQIVHELGDIPLRAAYTLIKAISKKKKSIIEVNREKFLEGAQAKGVSKKQASDLFELVTRFAGYGFNKSHSTGYAIIAYQTAYLKTYFPNQYMAAVLTFESAARKIDDWVPYLQECKRTLFPDHGHASPHVGVDVLPPDINRSETDFTVVFDEDEARDNLHGHVRFGLGAIKGVGRGVIGQITEERRESGPFTSIYDFCERIASRTAGRAVIEALVKCGAFDSVHGCEQRAAMLAALDDAMAAGQTLAQDRAAGQMNFFEAAAGGAGEVAPQPVLALPTVPPWDQVATLAAEQEVLGFHVSGHPLDRYDSILHTFCPANTRSPAELNHDKSIVLGGLLTRVRLTVVRNGPSAGEKMAMITIQDRLGSVDGVVFSGVFKDAAPLLEDGAIVVLAGRVDRQRGEPQIIVDEVMRPDDAPLHLAAGVEIELHEDRENGRFSQQMHMLAGLLKQAAAVGGAGRRGPSSGARSVEVTIHLHTAGRRVTLRPERTRVVPDATFMNRVSDLLGPGRARIVPGGAPKRRSGGPKRRFQPRSTPTGAVAG